MKDTIRTWAGDVIGALCLSIIMYALLWVPYVLAPMACSPTTEQCFTSGEKP